MRLICGLLMLDGSAVGPERLERMCGALQSSVRRGRQELWVEGPVGLGVVEFDAAAPGPLLARNSRAGALAADVRLDEGAELGQRLDLNASTDATICAAALAKWRDDAPLKMLGDFVLAYWTPGSRELFLARDSMGVRPLVYHFVQGRYFLFASFPRAIHASGLLPRELNEEALAHQMLSQQRAGETLSRGVHALPPGHWLRVSSSSGLRVECYWKPMNQRRRHASPTEAAQELRDLMLRAVRSRVRGNGPIAAHLSGGLDSSAIAVIAARLLGQEGRTLLGYSFLPATSSELADERPFVESVLAQEPEIVWKAVPAVGIEQRWRGRMDADRVLSLAEDDPENAVCADAGGNGANVVLSGWGGDEGATYNGRGALADAFLRLRWRYLAGEIGALKRRRGFRTAGILYGDVLTPIFPDAMLRLLERVRGREPRDHVGMLELLAPALRERVRRDPDESVRIGGSVRRNQMRLLTGKHLAQRTTNWALIGARYGLGFAFPLLDRRIVEFAISLPSTWHQRDGWKRRPFRDAMEGVLPPLIQWRHSKLTPFPDTLLEMSTRKRLLLERVEELSRHEFVHQILDVDQMRRMIVSLPEPEVRVRSTSLAATIPFVLISAALQYARYVEEHF